MKAVRILLFCTLVSTLAACQSQQDIPRDILGEWLLKTDYESPDEIIFRSDNTYLVYNDMEYSELDCDKASSIRIDDDESVTALTETGTWAYDNKRNLLTLEQRKFVSKSSEFNRYHGKAPKLCFKVKKLTDKELILCSPDKKVGCDAYEKNANPTNDPNAVFYTEIRKDYSGQEAKVIEVPLSGTETEVNFSNISCESPTELTLENKKHEQIFTQHLQPSQSGHTITTSLRGVTLLTIKIDTVEDKPWSFRVEIK